jgi:hypothetical protein
MATRSDELQLETDEYFQRHEWRVQRVGWIVWSLVIIAGSIGLLGSGPISATETIAPDGSLSVAYDRYLHYHHPTKLTLTSGKIEDQALRIKLDRQLLERLQIERIEPPPSQSEVTNDGVIYTFLQNSPLQNSKVVFHVDYEDFGSSRGTVEVIGYQPVTLKQFVYP